MTYTQNDNLQNGRGCAGVIAKAVGLGILGGMFWALSEVGMADDAKLVVHLGAQHSGTYNYNNDTQGFGLQKGRFEVGVYRHSYANKVNDGPLDGYAVYLGAETDKKTIGPLDVSLSGVVAYGYDEMTVLPMPLVNLRYKMLRASVMPGQLVGRDSAVMFSLEEPL